jgi:acyl carrier protein
MTEDIKTIVRTYMVESFLFGDAAAMPADGESLLEGGIIDSTGVLELVAFLEDRFGLAFADEDIVPENLDSLDAIAAFVGARTPRVLAA